MPKVKQAYLDARKSEIIDAAMACFARDGIHGSSISDIRDEAGVSNGAVYHYFRTKEEIITALRDRLLAEDLETYRDVEQNPAATDALADLLAEGMRLNHGSSENRDARVAVMLWAEALTSDAVFESQMRLMEPWREAALDLIDRGTADGSLDGAVDREALADVLTALSLGATVLEAWSPGRVGAERLAKTARALFAGDIWRDRPART